MPTWLILVLLIWPAFLLLRVLLVARLLLGLEFRRLVVTAVSAEEISPHLREAARPWVGQLEALGFKVIGGWLVRWGAESALDEEAVVLVRGTQPVRAVIRPHGDASRSGECWVELRTTTREGFEIVTASHAAEELVPLPPGLEVEVVATTLMTSLVQRHQERIAAVAPTAWVCTDLEGAVVREQSVCDGRFAQVQLSGLLAEREGGSWSYRPWAAVKRAGSIIRQEAARKKAAKGKGATAAAGTLSGESQAAFDLVHYRQMVALTSGRLSRRTKAVITVVSFLLFAAVLGWQTSPVVAVTLLIALVVHECGHLAGMRWFGHRDTQLLFVPFFGGAAVAHDDKVLPPWQHIVIILLGPLPGIFIGCAMLAYQAGGGAPAWLQEAALTTVVLNAFNLLPILPLDGGQIVDFAVASRFPRARVLFLGASALGLLLVGLALEGVQLLVGLAVFTLIRLPVEWRLAAVRRDMREEFPDGGEEEPVVRRLLEHLREPEWKKTAMSQRLQVVRGLQHVLRMPRPGFGTMCFALAGYTAPLWLGAPLAIWGAVRQGDAVVQRAEAKVREAGLLSPVGAAPAVVVAPEDNAGVMVAKAEALMGDGFKANASEANEAEIVALLRAAARKKVFVPVASADGVGGRKRGLLAIWGRGRVMGSLTGAAEEKLRFHEPVEAAALAIDALRLVRLLDTAPGWWNWETHREMVESAWTTVEEVLASGAKLPPAMWAELRALSDEAPEIAFAVAAIPRGMARQTRSMEEALAEREEGDEPDGMTKWRWLAALQNLSPDIVQMRVETLEQAVVAQGLMQAIQGGVWPELGGREKVKEKEKENGPKRAMIAVANLGDVLARQRQARVALALIERRLKGQPAVALEAGGHAAADLQHPFTREAMRLTRRGTLDVLTFTTGVTRLWGTGHEENGEGNGAAGGKANELVWRVPAGP